MKERNKHTKMVTQFGPIWPTLGERAALQSTKMKVIQMSYKRLVKKLTKEQDLISTHFHSTQTLNES